MSRSATCLQRVAYRARATTGDAAGLKIAEWRNDLEKEWPSLRLGRRGITRALDVFEVTIEVSLGAIDPQGVDVEVYAEARLHGTPLRQTMIRGSGTADCEGRTLYSASVPADRPADDYTVRVVPVRPGVSVPLENGLVRWER